MKIFDLYTSTIKGSKRNPNHPVTKHIIAMAKGFSNFGYEMRQNNGVAGNNDFGFIFGYTNGAPSIRESISQNHKKSGSPLMCFDTGVFTTWQKKLYSDNIAYRYGIDSPTGTGRWFNENMPLDRWNMFKKVFQINERPWQKDGYILVCMQALTGWNYAEKEPYDYWIYKIIAELKQCTSRKIVLRPHPRNGTNIKVLANKFNLEIDTIPNMQDSLMNAYACVTHSSSATIEAVVLGVHTFAFSENTMNYDVCNKDLTKIDLPELFDRDEFFASISYTTWLLDELDYEAPKHYLEGLNLI